MKRLKTVALVVLTLLSAFLPALTLPPFAAAASCGLFQNCTGPTVVGATNNALGHYNPGVAQDQQGNVYLFWDQNPGIYYVVTNTTNIACTTSCTPRQYSTNYNNYDLHPVPLTLKNGTLLMLFASKRGGTNNFGIYGADRKSTRLNSSHDQISYAVFCLKKKKITDLRRLDKHTTQRPRHD